jgi:hypothetical protein
MIFILILILILSSIMGSLYYVTTKDSKDSTDSKDLTPDELTSFRNDLVNEDITEQFSSDVSDVFEHFCGSGKDEIETVIGKIKKATQYSEINDLGLNGERSCSPAQETEYKVALENYKDRMQVKMCGELTLLNERKETIGIKVGVEAQRIAIKYTGRDDAFAIGVLLNLCPVVSVEIFTYLNSVAALKTSRKSLEAIAKNKKVIKEYISLSLNEPSKIRQYFKEVQEKFISFNPDGTIRKGKTDKSDSDSINGFFRTQKMVILSDVEYLKDFFRFLNILRMNGIPDGPRG